MVELLASGPDGGGQEGFQDLEWDGIKLAAMAGVANQRVQGAVRRAIAVEEKIAMPARLVFDFLVGLADGLETLGVHLRREVLRWLGIVQASKAVLLDTCESPPSPRTVQQRFRPEKVVPGHRTTRAR